MELADAFGRFNDPERREALRNHLSARLLPPQGWQMVPVEPTTEMIAAFKLNFKEGSIWTDRLTCAIEAMLAAAPKE
jgi:hypothetical protein